MLFCSQLPRGAMSRARVSKRFFENRIEIPQPSPELMRANDRRDLAAGLAPRSRWSSEVGGKRGTSTAAKWVTPDSSSSSCSRWPTLAKSGQRWPRRAHSPSELGELSVRLELVARGEWWSVAQFGAEWPDRKS